MKKRYNGFKKLPSKVMPMPKQILVSCMKMVRGVTQDYEKAVEWYQKAADQGHADKPNTILRCMYANGNGVLQEL